MNWIYVHLVVCITFVRADLNDPISKYYCLFYLEYAYNDTLKVGAMYYAWLLEVLSKYYIHSDRCFWYVKLEMGGDNRPRYMKTCEDVFFSIGQ